MWRQQAARTEKKTDDARTETVRKLAVKANELAKEVPAEKIVEKELTPAE
jgi:hypothetical protein